MQVLELDKKARRDLFLLAQSDHVVEPKPTSSCGTSSVALPLILPIWTCRAWRLTRSTGNLRSSTGRLANIKTWPGGGDRPTTNTRTRGICGGVLHKFLEGPGKGWNVMVASPMQPPECWGYAYPR